MSEQFYPAKQQVDQIAMEDAVVVIKVVRHIHTDDDLYLAVPHTVDQSVHIGISFNHAFHLILGTKPSKLLCVVCHDF